MVVLMYPDEGRDVLTEAGARYHTNRSFIHSFNIKLFYIVAG